MSGILTGMRKALDITGNRYGRLVAVIRAESKNGQTFWKCRCDCGTEKDINLYSLRKGITQSCGCLMRERGAENGSKSAAKRIKHNQCNTPEYKVWAKIIQRCRNPNDAAYPRYGGRGINVCDEWANSFIAFYTDMGKKPSGKYELDRVDNNGNYTPENCQWVSHKENSRNTKHSKRWYLDGIEYQSKTHAAKELGVSPTTIATWCNGCFKHGKQVPARKGCYSQSVYKT